MIAPPDVSQRLSSGVEDTRARILTAARWIFERKGTRGTTTREVADRAGVNEATLFRHFGSKRALLDAMRESACGADEMRSVLDGLATDDLPAALLTIARHTASMMVEKRAMMCISLAEEAVGTDDEPAWRGPSSVLDAVSAFFGVQIAAGRMRGDSLTMARCFLGMLFSYVVGRKLWDRTDVIDDAVLVGMIDIFLHGVQA
jgi:AcrR family transcriptional regulator